MCCNKYKNVLYIAIGVYNLNESFVKKKDLKNWVYENIWFDNFFNVGNAITGFFNVDTFITGFGLLYNTWQYYFLVKNIISIQFCVSTQLNIPCRNVPVPITCKSCFKTRLRLRKKIKTKGFLNFEVLDKISILFNICSSLHCHQSYIKSLFCWIGIQL